MKLLKINENTNAYAGRERDYIDRIKIRSIIRVFDL